jgi:class 3 adenylate cyclase/TolB-like protein/Tfp pilus assembly protein PilF
MADDQRRLAAIMFTDIVGYSALTQQDEALADELLTEHNAILRPIFSQFNGNEIKTMGDAFHLEFASALQATRCAVEIQQALHDRNQSTSSDKQISIRIGIHVGDVMPREKDVFGDTVNIASRIETLAAAGGICISEDVFHQVRNKIDIPILKLGKGDLKNIKERIEIFRLVFPWERMNLPLLDQTKFILQQKRTRQWLNVTVVVLIIAGAYAVWSINQPVPDSVDAKDRIAVLPFENLSEDPDANEYFSVGMHRQLESTLSEIASLRIVGHQSVQQFTGTNASIKEIGQRLRVGYLITGSIRKAAGHVRVLIQVIDVDSEEYLKAMEYDRNFDVNEVFSIQSDIALEVAKAMELDVTTSEQQKIKEPPTANTAAYNLFLEASFFAEKRTDLGLRRSIDLFDMALQLDPEFALAYSGLANSYILSAEYGHILPPAEGFAQARHYALRALEVDDTLADAHAALAQIKAEDEWDWNAAEEIFIRAIELNPNVPFVHHAYALILTYMGRFDEAIIEQELARNLDPLSLIINRNVGQVLACARRLDEAIVALNYTLELDPNYAYVRMILGQIYLARGMYNDALSTFQAASEDATSVHKHRLSIYIAMAHFLRGEENDAELILSGLVDSEFAPYLSFEMSAYYSVTGNVDVSFQWLQTAFEISHPLLPFIACHPLWDNIHLDPRFSQFLEILGLPDSRPETGAPLL